MFAQNGTTVAVLRAIKAFWKDQGYSPCIRDIMEATSISSTSVISYHIGKLERAGALRRTAGVARSYTLTDGVGGRLNLDFRKRSRIEKEVAGALKYAIDSHGPIVLQNRCSAAKRVYKALKELAKRNRPQRKAA